jgi:hypothetical protein
LKVRDSNWREEVEEGKVEAWILPRNLCLSVDVWRSHE